MNTADYMKDMEDTERYTHEYTCDVLERLGDVLVCEEMTEEDMNKFMA
jgi:hypothetical protein